MRKLFFLLCFLLSLDIVSAFTVEPSSLTDKLEPYAILSHKITINNSNLTQNFYLYFECKDESCNWFSFIDGEKAVSSLRFTLNPNENIDVYVEGMIPSNFENKDHKVLIAIEGDKEGIAKIPYSLIYWKQYNLAEKIFVDIGEFLNWKYEFPNKSIPAFHLKYLVYFFVIIGVILIIKKFI